MRFELALEGAALIFMFSVIFGGAAHLLLARSSTHWMWLIGAAAFAIGGLFVSEVLFGNATVDDVQPFIGGLAVDESLLGGLVVGIPVVLAAWYAVRRGRVQRPAGY
jgi:hypothetical protein